MSSLTREAALRERKIYKITSKCDNLGSKIIKKNWKNDAQCNSKF